MERVAIVGSRQRMDREAVARFVASLSPDAVVISGGCKGPDRFAAEAARARGLKVIEHLPDMTGLKDVPAGLRRHEATRRFYQRNQRIVNDCHRIAAFAAPDRKGGTEDTIRRGRKANRPINIL